MDMNADTDINGYSDFIKGVWQEFLFAPQRFDKISINLHCLYLLFILMLMTKNHDPFFQPFQ